MLTRLPHFRSFLREVRFGYLAASSILLFLLMFGLFEIITVTVYGELSELEIRRLHLTRGVLTILVLLAWIAWTLFVVRERYQRRVRQQDDQYRRILDASGDGVVISGEDGTVRFANPAALELLAIRESPIGRRLDELLPGTGPDNWSASHPTRKDWETTTSTGRLLGLSISDLSNPEGALESRLVLIRDITERSMRLAQMERSERLASLGHMAAGVAHEIGNPLTAISSMVQLLQRRVREEPVQEQLGLIRTHITRINRIVKDLVDFSRPKPSEQSLVSLSTVIHEGIGLLRHDARCRNIEFDVSEVQEVPSVLTVQDQLFQVIVNLILNAVDATAEVDKPVIRLGLHAEDGHAILSIRDNGSGIPPEVRDRIFEPFFTTKSVGKGTGLGLSVSHQIIHRSGGSIRFDSVPGRTTFEISLPFSG